MSKRINESKAKAGTKGGRARAAKLSAEERVAIAKKAAAARWGDRPRVFIATHVGNLELGGVTFECAVLDDGRRIISDRAFEAALSRARASGRAYRLRERDDLPIYLGAKCLNSFIPDGLKINRIRYRANGVVTSGVEAEVIPTVCEVWLKAREAKALKSSQLPTAARAEILMRGLARVGITALVDEATGYQYERRRNALAQILEQFVAKELARWAKRFPDEFYKEIYRLRDLPYAGESKHPLYMGQLTNNIIYSRLAPGVLEELRRKNPRTSKGHRRVKHHQWLTADIGHPKLQEHLGKVIALMQISPDYPTFINYLDRVAPRFGDTLMLPMPMLESIAEHPA